MQTAADATPAKLDWFPVLMLHRVVEEAPHPNPYNLCIPQDGLARVIEHLRRAGLELVTLDAAIDTWQRGESLARKACLTFDDGYEDFLTHAMPVLRDHDCPATVFLISDRLGETNTWDAGEGLPEACLLSPDQVLGLAAEGVSFGAHSATHRRLTTLDNADLHTEVAGAKHTLESLLQRPVRSFAYPYLDNDARVRAAVAGAGYEAACGGEQPAHEPMLLHRIDLPRFDTPSLLYRLNGWHRRVQAAPAARVAKMTLRSLTRGTRPGAGATL